MKNRRALVCGVSGQDGAYLAQMLLREGYSVVGTSRDASAATFENLHKLGIKKEVETISMSTLDFSGVISTIKSVQPDEIYYLAGQSSVGLSFEQPIETMESISTAVLHILEAIRFLGHPIRFFNAGSGECFGDTRGLKADEDFPFRPRSPYAIAKSSAHQLIQTYREAYGLYVCTGVLFNHESPLRLERFVTQKIVSCADRISNGSRERLCLGNIDIYRDWGWASDYVEAMWLMLQQQTPEDYVIATGESFSLEKFLARVFDFHGLDWKDFVDTSPALKRPSDIHVSCADPSKAKLKLGWTAKTKFDEVVKLMCEAKRSGSL